MSTTQVAHFLIMKGVCIMSRRSRDCYLCSTEYKYCPTCSQDRAKPTWMQNFHEENCKNIFDICTRYNMQMLTKEEAKAALETCDLSNKENFKDYVQRDLENIFAPEVKKTSKSHAVVNKTEE